MEMFVRVIEAESFPAAAGISTWPTGGFEDDRKSRRQTGCPPSRRVRTKKFLERGRQSLQELSSMALPSCRIR
jgi:hypothetical protein